MSLVPITEVEQDRAFYDPSFPKDHVRSLINHLCDLAYDGVWEWPHVVDRAYHIAQEKLAFAVGTTHQIEDIKVVVGKVNQRHNVFKMLLNKTGMKWDEEEHRFNADPDIWSEALQTEKEAKWYFEIGEPLWKELIILFEGWNALFEATWKPVASQVQTNLAIIPFSFNLDQFPVPEFRIPNSPIAVNRDILLPPTPKVEPLWSLDHGTPYPPMSPDFIARVLEIDPPLIQMCNVTTGEGSSNGKAKKKIAFEDDKPTEADKRNAMKKSYTTGVKSIMDKFIRK